VKLTTFNQYSLWFAGVLTGAVTLGLSGNLTAESGARDSFVATANGVIAPADPAGATGSTDDEKRTAEQELAGAVHFPADFPGLVKERPESAPFVEIEAGFMVPFTIQVPDTDLQFEFIPVPGGKVLLGSPESEEGREEIEGPQVEVAIEPFWMAKHEVTWTQYKHFMRFHDAFKRLADEGLRKITDENRLNAIAAPSNLYDPGFTYDAGEGPDEPAATMSQFSAKQFTKWLSLTTNVFHRLPTEPEWEYACRAGSTGAYSFGDDPAELETHAWFEDNADYVRHDVGQKEANAFGLYDMHGNVAEWVLDQAYEDGYSHLVDAEGLTVATAFRWPNQWFGRVAKGGSFELPAEQCRIASRLVSEDAWRDSDPNIPRSPYWHTSFPATGVGMRLMIPLKSPTDRALREKFWQADIPEIEEVARKRQVEEGRGMYGLVDENLEKQIEGR
jgi:sulfatase modifying factor 1